MAHTAAAVAAAAAAAVGVVPAAAVMVQTASSPPVTYAVPLKVLLAALILRQAVATQQRSQSPSSNAESCPAPDAAEKSARVPTFLWTQ